MGAKVQDVGLPTDAYYAVEDVHDVILTGGVVCSGAFTLFF